MTDKFPSYRMMVLAAAAAALAITPNAAAEGTIDPAQSTCHAANAGWLDWAPPEGSGITVTEAYLTGDAYAANLGWVRFAAGTPANGYQFANDSSSDFGVNHDGAGNLGGYAFGANVGWINFGWAAPDDPARPRLDLVTGKFHGFAYSANLGWINLGTETLVTTHLDCPDSDQDGLADAWEMEHFGSLAVSDGTADHDHDGASARDEYQGDTDPLDGNDYFDVAVVELQRTAGRGSDLRALVEFTSKPSRLYELWTSADLQGFQMDATLGTIVPSSGATTTVSHVHPDGSRHFYRVGVKRPLKP